MRLSDFVSIKRVSFSLRIFPISIHYFLIKIQIMRTCIRVFQVQKILTDLVTVAVGLRSIAQFHNLAEKRVDLLDPPKSEIILSGVLLI